MTGVNRGYDVNVRKMAADGIHIVGRLVGASDGSFAIAANANQVLDEADSALAGFLHSARAFRGREPGPRSRRRRRDRCRPAPDDPRGRVPQPAAGEHRGDRLGDRLSVLL